MEKKKERKEGEMLEKMKLEAYMFPEGQYDELGFKLELLGSESLDGEDCYKIKVIDPIGGEKTGIDRETDRQA